MLKRVSKLNPQQVFASALSKYRTCFPRHLCRAIDQLLKPGVSAQPIKGAKIQ